MDELDGANPAWTLRLEESGDSEGTWDPDRLSQVFSNLVANAIQHGRPEAGVTVKVDGRADRVRVAVHNLGAVPATAPACSNRWPGGASSEALRPGPGPLHHP